MPFSLCNGRFPSLILLGTIFFGTGGLTTALLITGLIALGGRGVHGGLVAFEPDGFEGGEQRLDPGAAPFRRPRNQVIVRSLLDRTLFVAGGLWLWRLRQVCSSGCAAIWDGAGGVCYCIWRIFKPARAPVGG